MGGKMNLQKLNKHKN